MRIVSPRVRDKRVWGEGEYSVSSLDGMGWWNLIGKTDDSETGQILRELVIVRGKECNEWARDVIKYREGWIEEIDSLI